MPSRHGPTHAPGRTTDRKSALWAVAALSAGLLLRVVFIVLHPRWGGDTLVYGSLAENMLTHHVFGFTDPTLRPTLIRLPGYPLFLAACFVLFGHANYLAVLFVQAVIDLVGCVLLAVLAGRLLGSPFGSTAARITLWLAALCPFTANYAGTALTETLSIFCVTLAIFALERVSTHWKQGRVSVVWSLVVGMALSYATLVRPDQGLLAAAVVPAMLWLTLRTPGRSVAQRLAPASLATLVVMLPLLFWGVRNWRVFHVVQPLSPRYANDPGETVPLGFQRWFRTWGVDYKSTFDVYWNYDGAPLDIHTVPARAFVSPAQRDATAALFDQYNQQTTATPEFDAAFAHLADETIAAHPFRYYVLMPLARVADMWLRPRAELLRLPIDWWVFPKHPLASVAEFLYALLNAALLSLAVLGFVRWRRSRYTGHAAIAYAMAGFALLRCLLLLTLDNSEPRYTLECYPVVLLCAGIALATQSSKLATP